jgi:hypothetical protein
MGSAQAAAVLLQAWAKRKFPESDKQPGRSNPSTECASSPARTNTGGGYYFVGQHDPVMTSTSTKKLPAAR